MYFLLCFERCERYGFQFCRLPPKQTLSNFCSYLVCLKFGSEYCCFSWVQWCPEGQWGLIPFSLSCDKARHIWFSFMWHFLMAVFDWNLGAWGSNSAVWQVMFYVSVLKMYTTPDIAAALLYIKGKIFFAATISLSVTPRSLLSSLVLKMNFVGQSRFWKVCLQTAPFCLNESY